MCNPMRVKAPIISLLASIFLATATIPAPCARAEAPEVSAQSAALIEGSTKKTLYGKSAHTKLPMASTTKIMTALIALENGNLDDMVKTPDEAYGAEGSSIYLNKGEAMSLRDLLYGLMLNSGNDAAVSIAIHIAGSVEAFASMMNARASRLGANNTHYVTPNGLHDQNHYTTAYDLALIAAEAMANETFREIVGTQYHKTSTGDVSRTFKNKNKLLWQYEGGNGVKTGYTMKAGKCLVFSAEREGMQLIGVVLNCPSMFPDSKKILDYGFNSYEMSLLAPANSVIARVLVKSGVQNPLELTIKNDIMVPVPRDAKQQFTTRVELRGEYAAPIAAGEICGHVEIWDDGTLIIREPLYAATSVEKEKGFGYYLTELFMRWVS